MFFVCVLLKKTHFGRNRARITSNVTHHVYVIVSHHPGTTTVLPWALRTYWAKQPAVPARGQQRAWDW